MSRAKGDFQKKENNEKNEFRQKLVRHRLTIFYRIVLVVLAIVAISFGLYYNYQNMVYTSYEVLKRVEFE